ncbi:hypothetical protein BDF14DRAFT_1876128 [Spinellus fusiger]|nr:hypothetical protein BDF14DRAFT_1876128 [Spinellus fusiger]
MNDNDLILEKEDFQLVQIKYKSYSHAQIAGFIHSLQEEGCLVPEAAKKASIPHSTANRIGGKELPGFKRSSKHDNCGRPPILIKEYIQFLTKYIDSNTASTPMMSCLKLSQV